MRLKKTIFPLLLGGILLSVLSCAKEDEFELPTLILSETSVAFDRGASERNISVSTNQEHWTAASPQEGDWLTLIQDGDMLKLKVAENKMGNQRMGHVIVNALSLIHI